MTQNTACPSAALPDVQSTQDTRNIAIERVGIRDFKLPIRVDTGLGEQATIGTFTMTVALPADQKGTHMSRFVPLMDRHQVPLNADVMKAVMADMLETLHATEGTLKVSFPLFIEKAAPVSGLKSLMNYEGGWTVTADATGIHVRQETVAPVTSLCPCSKEISKYGAHNQRSHLTAWVELGQPFSLSEQIRLCEASASCPVWSRLKRADEKFVTEHAYENPKFVEDLIRDMAGAFNRAEAVEWYHIEAENFESIHNHSAYAYITHDKRRA